MQYVENLGISEARNPMSSRAQDLFTPSTMVPGHRSDRMAFFYWPVLIGALKERSEYHTSFIANYVTGLRYGLRKS